MLTIKLLKNSEVAPYLSEMWQIYRKYYNVSEELFMKRALFSERQAMFFDKQKLVGFTAIVVDRNISIGNKPHTLVGLEQSVIEKAYRNQNLIQRLCTRLLLQEKWKNPFSKIYIWSINASHLPYLIFTQYLKTAYPSHACTLSQEAKDIMAFLGKTHRNTAPFQYYPDTPFCSYNKPNFIIDSTTKIHEKDLKNPHIAYYQQLEEEGKQYLQNPAHHILVTTIAPANWGNFAFWAKRFLLKQLQKQRKNAYFPVLNYLFSSLSSSNTNMN